MVKCYFMGLDDVFDRQLAQTVYEELETLVATEDNIEFWFYLDNPYTLLCHDQALLSRSRHPQKAIRIVHIYDGDKSNVSYSAESSSEAENERFPGCFADRKIFAPKDIIHKPIKGNRVTDKVKAVERWILKQCNYAFVYFYPNLQHKGMREILYAKNTKSITLIPLYFKETAMFINEQIELLPDRHRMIMHYLNHGKTKAWVADALGVTSSAIQSNVFTATHRIKENLRRRATSFPQAHIQKCCFFSCIEGMNARRIHGLEKLFECLATKCGIRKFIYNQSTCAPDFISALLLLCNRYRYMKVSAVKAEHLEIGKNGDEELLRTCSVLVTEASANEMQHFKEFCQSIGTARLVDFSKATEEIYPSAHCR